MNPDSEEEIVRARDINLELNVTIYVNLKPNKNWLESDKSPEEFDVKNLTLSHYLYLTVHQDDKVSMLYDQMKKYEGRYLFEDRTGFENMRAYIKYAQDFSRLKKEERFREHGFNQVFNPTIYLYVESYDEELILSSYRCPLVIWKGPIFLPDSSMLFFAKDPNLKSQVLKFEIRNETGSGDERFTHSLVKGPTNCDMRWSQIRELATSHFKLFNIRVYLAKGGKPMKEEHVIWDIFDKESTSNSYIFLNLALFFEHTQEVVVAVGNTLVDVRLFQNDRLEKIFELFELDRNKYHLRSGFYTNKMVYADPALTLEENELPEKKLMVIDKEDYLQDMITVIVQKMGTYSVNMYERVATKFGLKKRFKTVGGKESITNKSRWVDYKGHFTKGVLELLADPMES